MQLMNLSIRNVAKLATQDPSKQLINLNCLLGKLAASNYLVDSLRLFKQIISFHGLRPDQYTLSTVLSVCANSSNIALGNQLHAYTLRTGLKSYSHVANTLLSLYTKSNHLGSVKKVFSDIDHPDVYSWTTLLSACTKLGEVEFACKLINKVPDQNVALWNAVITGCAGNGHQHHALELFRKMNAMDLGYDKYTLASVLSLCSPELFDFGRQLHALMIRGGFFFTSVVNSLLSMYFTCERAVDAFEVFKGVDDVVRDQITYNTMMNGLVSLSRDEEALMIFKEMQELGLRPTKLTFVGIMSSCLPVSVRLQFHGQSIKLGFEASTVVTNAAMAMYIDHGVIDEARKMFDELEERDLVSWNTMIMGYDQNRDSRLAILTYMQMQTVEVAPDEYTIGSLLASCECLEVVQVLHAVSLKSGLSLINEVQNGLISALSKHGDISQAYQVFSLMPRKNLITWNAMISGFSLNGLPLLGLDHFSELLKCKLRPDAYALTLILTVCASIPALRPGKEVHGYILKFEHEDPSLDNALIAFYAKCGVLNWSVQVFNRMAVRNTVSWNSMISAFAQHGEGTKAVECFTKMQNESGCRPDHATFTAVLSACSHTGLLEGGISIFNSMVNDYGLEPGEDHFSCLVDLLGRSGYLNETEDLVKAKNFAVDSHIWWTLFSACATYGNVRLGKIVAEVLLESEQENGAVYVMLSNMYAAAGKWEEAAEMRKMMKCVGALKQPGCSWS